MKKIKNEQRWEVKHAVGITGIESEHKSWN